MPTSAVTGSVESGQDIASTWLDLLLMGPSLFDYFGYTMSILFAKAGTVSTEAVHHVCSV